MTFIPFFGSDYSRKVAQEPYVQLLNRYAEQNPALNESPVSVISRPAMRKSIVVGDGPIRKVYSAPGAFGGDLFVVSGINLYRVNNDLDQELIGTISTDPVGDVSMAVTAPIGDVPAYLYIAEGSVLWVYTSDGPARGNLAASGVVNSGDTVRIGDTYYQFTTGDVDLGTPDGTSGNPWLVDQPGSPGQALISLYNAINGQGNPGVDYSTDLLENPDVKATNVTTTDLYVEATTYGVAGNGIVTTTTGANLSWGAGTLEDGATSLLRQVQMPDDLGAISVAHINSYIIVIPVQTDDNKGQFYWIEPGETTVDPLNFATAERNPDGLHQVIVFGDLFWLLGENTTEPWTTTGNPETPMQRYRGILFDRGSWAGTAVQVKDSLIVVDEDGGVFQIKNGQKRISRPDIEERIRRSKQTQKSTT